MTDDSKVYHKITFGEDRPGYKPKDDDLPSDKPVNNDQRFCYYTEVKWWKDCQVKEERTLRVASDKVQGWLDIGYTNNPDLSAVFPPSQEEANQATTANKKAGKGAKKRPSSVPPASDTAKAKQAKAQSDAGEKKAAAEKVRRPTIPKHELSAIAAKLTTKVRTVVPTLEPKHYRTIQNLAAEWYKALYHTKFQLTKSEYLKHLHKTAEGNQRAKETNPHHLDAFIKALDVLKYSVNAPTTAGLRDPTSVQSELLAAQQQSKPKGDKPAPDSYAAAVTGQTANQPLPIGAKRPSGPPAKQAKAASAGGPATQARSIDEEIQDELEKGRGFQDEASSLEQLMFQRCLTPVEVDRLRTVTAAAEGFGDFGTESGSDLAIGTVAGTAVLSDSGGSYGNSDHC